MNNKCYFYTCAHIKECTIILYNFFKSFFKESLFLRINNKFKLNVSFSKMNEKN